jgi:ABC-type phosphate/phosphonate transport system substrate-binding protein
MLLVPVAWPAAAQNLLFAVNEGTSSSADAFFLRGKYADLAAHLGRATGGTVKTETSNILPIVARNLERQRYDVLLIRPSHIAARAMRDHGYRLLVVARGESRVHFIVPGDSSLQSLNDVRGRFIALPDELAYPSVLGLAVLRDAGIDTQAVRLQHMNRQEAVGYAVRNKLADVGVVISYSGVARNWEKEGGRFLHTRDKLPYWSIIVSPRVSPATEAKLRAALLDLDKSAMGRDMLKQIGIEGFEVGEQRAYLDMLDWVEGKRR